MKHLPVAIAAVGIMWAFAWCTKDFQLRGQENAHLESMKHLERGHCRDGWGNWEICK